MKCFSIQIKTSQKMALLTESWRVDLLTVLIGALAIVYFLFKKTYTYWERKGIKVIPGKSFLFGHFQKTLAQKEFVGDAVKRLYNSTNEPFIGIYSILRPILLVCFRLGFIILVTNRMIVKIYKTCSDHLNRFEIQSSFERF